MCVCLCVYGLRKELACPTRRGAAIKISPGLSQSLSPLLKTKSSKKSDGMLDNKRGKRKDKETLRMEDGK